MPRLKKPPFQRTGSRTAAHKSSSFFCAAAAGSTGAGATDGPGLGRKLKRPRAAGAAGAAARGVARASAISCRLVSNISSPNVVGDAAGAGAAAGAAGPFTQFIDGSGCGANAVPLGGGANGLTSAAAESVEGPNILAEAASGAAASCAASGAAGFTNGLLTGAWMPPSALYSGLDLNQSFNFAKSPAAFPLSVSAAFLSASAAAATLAAASACITKAPAFGALAAVAASAAALFAAARLFIKAMSFLVPYAAAATGSATGAAIRVPNAPNALDPSVGSSSL
ncbi:MAG: hypothetical protein JW395_2377 [Nitrospira sp.]|nr:hypothetical protein [Nitrospira sp.]